MIFYRPTDGNPHIAPLRLRPRTCFLMTQLGEPVPPEITEIREAVGRVLAAEGYEAVDADSVVTGRDFLLKIWEILVAVPFGIAIIHEEMRPGAVANVFYELGLMQAYGKETLVVKTSGVHVPSDFVRTEYIEYGTSFAARLKRFLAALAERAEHYREMADLLENDPLLAIDYLRRAYLLTGAPELKQSVARIVAGAGLEMRAKHSVEMLLANFGRTAAVVPA